MVIIASTALAASTEPRSVSCIYPHPGMFNDEGECGTEAVVPWAGGLWVVTYSPHEPAGSSDKLYEITCSLEPIIRPESIGGTPANRMIHRESEQLFIGSYAIRTDRSARWMTSGSSENLVVASAPGWTPRSRPASPAMRIWPAAKTGNGRHLRTAANAR